ncbi:MAG: hypothetical protein V1782_09880 [Pseudomonadota bacterium]
MSEYIKAMQNLEIQTSASYDKAILTLSGGALAISITFINSQAIIGPTCLLTISWVLWALSIVSILISLVTGQFSIRKAIKYYIDSKEDIKGEKIFNPLHYVTLFLNILSGITFIIGVFLFLTFAIQTTKETKMTNKDIDKIFTQEVIDKISSQIAHKIITELEKKGPLVLYPPKEKPKTDSEEK